jgi:thiosulfate dehydrogenase
VSAFTRSLAVLACLGALPLGCSGEAETRVAQGTAADHGRALFGDPAVSGTSFNAYACSTCHEPIVGDAGDAILPGAALAGAVGRPSYWGGQEVDLLGAINQCLYFFMLKDAPWTADEVEAQAMYAYLESLPGGGSAAEAVPFTPVYALREPPPGDAARGDGIYRRACATCHGEARSGAKKLIERAPVLPDQTLEAHSTHEYTAAERRLVFVEKIRHGGFVGYGGEMPPFSRERLSDQEIGDLLAFFRLP